MKKDYKQKKILRIVVYVLGILLTALGANILLRSALGAGAWDTVTSNLSHLANITLGIASASINITLLILIIIYHKDLKYLFILVPIFGISLSLDFWDLIVLGEWMPLTFLSQSLWFVVGTLVLTLGLSLIVASLFPAMIFDELTYMLMKVLHIKSFFVMRIFIELFAVVLATIFGFLAGIQFGAVNFGTFLLAIIIGPLITFHLKWLQRLLQMKVEK